MAADPTAAELAATVREALLAGSQWQAENGWPALAALDALVARCDQLERERDEAKRREGIAWDHAAEINRRWYEVAKHHG